MAWINEAIGMAIALRRQRARWDGGITNPGTATLGPARSKIESL